MSTTSASLDVCRDNNPAVTYDELLAQQQRADRWEERLQAWVSEDPLPDLREYLKEHEKEEYRELKELFDFSELTADMVYDRICELECLACLRYKAQILENERISDFTSGSFDV